jgi:hypothetical protein
MLTVNGLRMGFDLGRQLRSRYVHGSTVDFDPILSGKWNSDKVFLRSSLYGRTVATLKVQPSLLPACLPVSFVCRVVSLVCRVVCVSCRVVSCLVVSCRTGAGAASCMGIVHGQAVTVGLYPELGHDSTSASTDPAHLPVKIHSVEFPHDTVYPITAGCPRLRQLHDNSA